MEHTSLGNSAMTRASFHGSSRTAFSASNAMGLNSRSGMRNASFTGSRLGIANSTASTSRFGTPFGSRLGTMSASHAMVGARATVTSNHVFARSFPFGRFRDHDFDDFRFRCFGCGFNFFGGFGFGFGFGFGWGWGGWWGPWWNPWWGPWGFWGPAWAWDPGWWGPSPYSYPPAAYDYNYDRPIPGYTDDSSANPSSSYESVPDLEGSPNTNPETGNVAASTPTVLLYLKDGTTFAASDYWVADGKLHYYVNYSGESSLDMSDLDLQRTVDENAKRGVRFTLKPGPARKESAPATAPPPGTGTAALPDNNTAEPDLVPAPEPAQAALPPALQHVSFTVAGAL